MVYYTVKQVAHMSGVSIRTLHYYHKIGLLLPFKRNEAGYRLYTQTECLMLQQILFYRELGFSLEEIRHIFNKSDFNMRNALESHKQRLLNEKERLDMLILTIDKTLYTLNSEENMMKTEDLYQGLNRETAERYRREAIKKYGKETIQRSEDELMKLGKKDFEKLKTDFDACVKRLYMLMDKSIDSDQVQAEILIHYTLIRAFWGTSGTKDTQSDAYMGLGELYTRDERFTMINGEAQPEFADFLRRAMTFFAENNL